MNFGSRLRVPIGPRDHIRGDLHALFTLVEYGDYECPHCGAAYPVVESVCDVLGSDLAFVYRHFPLTHVHPHADNAAEAAEAAGAQQRFWAMHDWLFQNQDALDDQNLVEYARSVGLDLGRFAGDLASHAHLPRVREDFTGGARSGVNGRPTFFINSLRYDGPRDVNSLVAAIRSPFVLPCPQGRGPRG
jgi:protein-disulfide isomerase